MQTTSTPPADNTAAGTRPGVIIGLLVVSAFVMILNETIMSVALPVLIGKLGVSATTVQWLTSGFLLTMAVVIPTTGYLLQRFSPRQIYLSAMTLFSIGTLICALSPGFGMLLAGRVVQASGTAMMIPLVMTTVMTLVPEDRRGSMMGNISLVIAVAPAIGPMVGGVILGALNWPWMFWIVLPLALIMLGLGYRMLRLESTGQPGPLDVPSVLLSAVGFSGIVYGFSALGAAAQGGAAMPPWIPLSVGAIGLAGFITRQMRLQRRGHALLDLRPFTHRRFVVMVILGALLFMCLLGAGAVLLPLYLQGTLGVGPRATGLAVLPGGLMMGLLGRPVGWLYDRVGARPLVIPGSIAVATAMWLFVVLGEDTSLGAVIAVHILLMSGLGLMMTPLMTDSLSVLSNELYSHGSAIMATLQQVAGAAGTAAFVAVSAMASGGGAESGGGSGMQAGFIAAGIVGLLAVAVALFVPRKASAAEPTAPSGKDAESVDVPTAP